LRTRSDPAAWLLGGMAAAGVGAAWLLWHPSASQLYFFLCAGPFGVVLTVWALAERTRRWWVPAGGLAAGALWTIFAPDVALPSNKESWGEWSWVLGLPVLRTLGLIVLVAVALFFLRPFSWRRWSHALTVGVVAAVLGASFATGADSYVQVLRAGPDPTPPPTARLVTAPEMRAALWLGEHAGNNDVIATNVHCVPMARYRPCDARAFWVAGIAGRRTLVESWAYSDATVAANGVDNLKYVLQPPPDPEKYALNQRTFTDASPADVETLRRTHGVKWLFADTRAGKVSPQLAQLAPVRYRSGPVTIYELP
jgi:hypothetical protein